MVSDSLVTLFRYPFYIPVQEIMISLSSQRGWGSKKICIVIRKYPNNGYNAQVFNQECVSCGELGRMHINVDSYVERVAYRLKKWAGIAVERPAHAGSLDRPPHKSELCEGCKRGFCQAGDWE